MHALFQLSDIVLHPAMCKLYSTTIYLLVYITSSSSSLKLHEQARSLSFCCETGKCIWERREIAGSLFTWKRKSNTFITNQTIGEGITG